MKDSGICHAGRYCGHGSIVIGVAFGKVVSAFICNIQALPLGMLTGNTGFSNLFINLGGDSCEIPAAAREAGTTTINYGVFVGTVADFGIVACAILRLRGR